jgi:hypothetical protein
MELFLSGSVVRCEQIEVTIVSITAKSLIAPSVPHPSEMGHQSDVG